MFWKVSSFSSGSAIEGILDKQQVTLEELLEEDEMVQVAANLSASSRCLSRVQTPVLTCIQPIVFSQAQVVVLMIPFVQCISDWKLSSTPHVSG